MKNMKKLLQRAMVFTLSAAMLVGTPMTASASGLVEIYKTEDGWGNPTEGSDNDTRTGTATSTASDTGSRILEVDTDGKLLGIVLSNTDVTMELDGAYNSENNAPKVPLNVEFVWQENKADPEMEAELGKLLKWETSDKNIVSLNNPNKNGDLREMELRAKAGGSAKVTVSLNDYARNIHFTTTADIFVKQYATFLGFKPELDDDAFEGASLDLVDYLEKDPDTANDEITYEVVSGNGSIKNGVLKLGKIKANKPESEKVVIVAIGERKKSDKKEITIQTARPATKIAIAEKGQIAPVKGTYDWLVNTKAEQEFEVLFATKTVKDWFTRSDKTQCTDDITWTSKKPDIVTIGTAGSNAKKVDSVTLVPHKVGKAQIIAQTSTGKKATLTVNVRANLTGLTITTESGTLYSGQSIKLGANQFFGKDKDNVTENINFTDAGLTWKFDDSNKDEAKKMKNVASINANTGVLTIKPDLANVKDEKKPAKIVVTVTNKKAVGNKKTDESDLCADKGKIEPSNGAVEFDFKQVNVTSIIVYNNTKVKADNILAAAEYNATKNKFDLTTNKTAVQIPVDSSRSYAVRAIGEVESGEKVEFDIEDALNWASSNEKVATAAKNENKTGTVAGIKKGSANIKVSSACKMKNEKYKAITATVKTQITAPTKSLKLSTKNSAIAATNKKQTITIKATLDKGSTSKAKDIIWTATQKRGDKVELLEAKNGKVTLAANSYEVDDIITVTAKIPNAGVQSSMTFKVVTPSYKVEFKESKEDKTKVTKITKESNAAPFDLVTMIQENSKNGEWVLPTEDSTAEVTYTVSTKGIVQLVGNKVTPIKKGTVKITATTTDGKKATVTVQITE